MITLATTYYRCGTIIPKMAYIIPRLTSTVVDLLKIGVPVILIIFGMIDFGKAAMGQKDDEIKKNQQIFLKRLLSAALVFFIFIIVEILFNLVSSEDPAKEKTIWDCVNCFINGPSSCEGYVPSPDEPEPTPEPDKQPEEPEPDEQPENPVLDTYFTMLPASAKPKITSKSTPDADNCRCHPTKKTLKPHHGIDIKAAYDTPIYAFDDGTVYKMTIQTEYKCESSKIMIKHTTDEGKVYYTQYIHMNRHSNELLKTLKKGDTITKGQLIGYVGGITSEDACSTGAHLHFQVYDSAFKTIRPEVLLDNQKKGIDVLENKVRIPTTCNETGACK